MLEDPFKYLPGDLVRRTLFGKNNLVNFWFVTQVFELPNKEPFRTKLRVFDFENSVSDVVYFPWNKESCSVSETWTVFREGQVVCQVDKP